MHGPTPGARKQTIFVPEIDPNDPRNNAVAKEIRAFIKGIRDKAKRLTGKAREQALATAMRLEIELEHLLNRSAELLLGPHGACLDNQCSGQRQSQAG